MQAREFLREFDEQNQYGTLVSVLNFLKSSADKRGLTPKISTPSLINMVKNAGQTAFEYADLAKANDADPTVKNLIKSFNKDEVIVAGDIYDWQIGEYHEFIALEPNSRIVNIQKFISK